MVRVLKDKPYLPRQSGHANLSRILPVNQDPPLRWFQQSVQMLGESGLSCNSNTQSCQQNELFLESFFEIPVGDDLPSVHDNDPLSVSRDEIQTMLHNNNGESQLSPQVICSPHHFFCSPRIKKRCRFV